MPRKPKKERVPCEYFSWLLGTRNGVFYADGRSGGRNLGRHSLGTRDRDEALELLRRLDLTKAVDAGLADASLLKSPAELLPLEEGRRRYMEYVTRPAIQGGAAPSTEARYRTVFAKFAEFAEGVQIRYWQQVNKDALGRYGKWLENGDYHDKTQYIELTVIKQALKWLVEEGLLPASSLFRMPLKKSSGTSTYCYSREQVQAILAHCRAREDLHWLADVVVALSYTGLRIGELADLRWSDIDLEKGVLRLTDTTRRGRKSQRREARSTKSHRDRTLPVHAELRPVLEGLPHHADGRVFHGPEKGKIKPDTVRNILKREVLGPLAEKFPASGGSRGIAAGRLHSFRHFFCSMSADSGVPEQMLMSLLGHRDSEMIRHYYHLQEEEARKQMSKLPSLSETPAVPTLARKDQPGGETAGAGDGQEQGGRK
jgi:integrase